MEGGTVSARKHDVDWSRGPRTLPDTPCPYRAAVSREPHEPDAPLHGGDEPVAHLLVRPVRVGELDLEEARVRDGQRVWRDALATRARMRRRTAKGCTRDPMQTKQSHSIGPTRAARRGAHLSDHLRQFEPALVAPAPRRGQPAAAPAELDEHDPLVLHVRARVRRALEHQRDAVE